MTECSSRTFRVWRSSSPRRATRSSISDKIKVFRDRAVANQPGPDTAELQAKLATFEIKLETTLKQLEAGILQTRVETKAGQDKKFTMMQEFQANLGGRIAECANHSAMALVSRVTPMEVEIMQLKTQLDSNAIYHDQVNWSAAAGVPSAPSDPWAASAAAKAVAAAVASATATAAQSPLGHGLSGPGPFQRHEGSSPTMPNDGWRTQVPPAAAPALGSKAHKPKFVERTATSDRVKYPDDKQSQVRWIKTTTNYLIGRAIEMKETFNWAEQYQSREVAEYDVITLRCSPWMRETDSLKLSTDLWSFLKLTMAESRDRAFFDYAPAGNGFDAWRRIVVPVGPRSEEGLRSMHREVTRPRHSASLANLERDLDKWEADLDEYYRCWGDRLQERTKVMTAKDIIPEKMDASVLMAVRNCSTYSDLRYELRESVRYLLDHGVGGGRLGAHLMEPEPCGTDGPSQPSSEGEWEEVPAVHDLSAGTFATQEAKDQSWRCRGLPNDDRAVRQ